MALLIALLGAGAIKKIADRHLPRDRHPRRQRHLDLQRALGRGDGAADHRLLRVRDLGERQQHQVDREPVDRRSGPDQGLLPPGHEDRAGPDAGHGREPGDPAPHAARRAAADDPALQPEQRPDRPARPLERHAQRGAALRLRDLPGPPAAGGDPGDHLPDPLRRQGPPGDGRRRPAPAAGAGALALGRRGRDRRAEPDAAHGRGPARRAGVHGQPELEPGDDRGLRLDPGPDRERPDGLPARRGRRPRRQRRPAQRGPQGRQARRAPHDPQGQRGLDPRHHRRGQGAPPEPARRGPEGARAGAPLRPVALRAGRRRRRGEGEPDRVAPHGRHDPRVPRELAEHGDR